MASFQDDYYLEEVKALVSFTKLRQLSRPRVSEPAEVEVTSTLVWGTRSTAGGALTSASLTDALVMRRILLMAYPQVWMARRILIAQLA